MDNQNNRNKQNLPGNNNPNNKNNRQRWNIILFTVMLISFYRICAVSVPGRHRCPGDYL